MFNNANVLFKTKFVDGVSTVTRYAQTQSRPALSSTTNIGSGKEPGKKAKKTRHNLVSETTTENSENVG